MSRLKRRRWIIGLVAMGGLAALACASFTTPEPHWIYNASASVPVGWYRVEPAKSLQVGTIVLTRLPPEVLDLAAQRGYLPAHIPLLKRVGAVGSQHVCMRGDLVHVDGMPMAVALPADRWGRPLSHWPQCRVLADGELFLLSTDHPGSFDSRYYGPVGVDSVIGQARRIWQ